MTRGGRWLRQSKLDELPQLFNVLRGEMRLIGYRPELPRFVALFPAEYHRLWRDRPGLTDPASLRFRNEQRLLTGPEPERVYIERILPEKLQLSLEYARVRSWRSDLRLLLATLGAPLAPPDRP